MDDPDHGHPRAIRAPPLQRVAPLDRRDFAEDADPNAARSRTGRLSQANELRRDSAAGRKRAYPPGADALRPARLDHAVGARPHGGSERSADTLRSTVLE